MGHSNIMVSLTYLRGLDVAELKEEDMPHLYFKGDIDDIVMWSTRFLDRIHIPYVAEYGF